MSTNKKALFFDIDGTILSEVTGKIPESASAALQKAHDLGHLLFINTGRTICCLPPMMAAEAILYTTMRCSPPRRSRRSVRRRSSGR